MAGTIPDYHLPAQHFSTIVYIEGYSKPSDHPFISNYMKGIYNQYLTLPRSVSIWDVNVLLAWVRTC